MAQLGESATPSPRPRHRIFQLTGWELDGRTIRLGYRLAGGEDADVGFEERLDLPDAVPAPDGRDAGVRALVDGIHRACGVSYFKAAIPPEIQADPVPPADAAFWDTLYTHGLGEFYFRNGLDPRGRARFPRGGSPPPPVERVVGDERVLVLAGGGKDSAVAREIVRHAGVAADALSVGTAPWIDRSVAAMGLRHLVVRRRVDPTLFELNARGAWNGHVPISACIAFIATLVAYAGDYSAVIVANERSADDPTLMWNGLAVNHQWSKSLGFEQAFQQWCARRWSGAPIYFSILRSLGEVGIAEAFARHDAYFDRFTSCNGNFRQRPSAEPPRWCGRCPKCVFVQLMLAPQLDDPSLHRIFGGDFISDRDNLSLLESLAGVRGPKPFECVGTVDETRAALARLAEAGRLPGPVRDWYARNIADALGGDAAGAWNRAREPHGPHRIPPNWEARLHAYLRSARA